MITILDTFENITATKEEKYEILKRVGFDGVMLPWSADYGDITFKDNPKLARDAGLFIENIHAPFKDANEIWNNNQLGEMIIESHIQLVNDCYNEEISTIVLHLTGGDTPPEPSLIGLERLKRLIFHAYERDITIALENLRTIKHIEYVLENINTPNLGICFDSGHQNCFTKESDILNYEAFNIKALHLHDNNGLKDQHLLPGDGLIKWEELIPKIYKKYNGPIALEIVKKEDEEIEPVTLFTEAYSRAKKLETYK